MKAFLLILTIFIQNNLFASYFQEKCSNASGTVLYQTGHANNSITVKTDGVLNTYRLGNANVEITKSEKAQFSSVRKGSCKPGDTAGFYTFDSHSYMKMSAIIMDQDIKIEDFFICHRSISGMMPCNLETK